MAYSRTRYGTGYYIYHQFAPGTKLSQPVRSWDAKTAPDEDVLALIRKSGTDLVPKVQTPEGDKADIRQHSGDVT